MVFQLGEEGSLRWCHLSSGRGATREGPASCGEGCPGSLSSGEASDWGGGTEKQANRLTLNGVF